MCKSLLNELRFTIGEQYELNEFNLKSIESTFSNGLEYENYQYVKDDLKTIFGLNLVSNVILQYNGDILSRFVYTLDSKDLTSLVNRINNYLTEGKKLTLERMPTSVILEFYKTYKIQLSIEVDNRVFLKVCKISG